MDAVPEKQQAHELIDQLEPSELSAVIRILKRIVVDPVLQAVAKAPADDEPVSNAERQALARSEAWFQQRGGKGIPIEEVLAEFGLTADDFPNDSPS
ncbi:MAG: hypothetical protein WD733_24310 [Bryobacterales bacterium]